MKGNSLLKQVSDFAKRHGVAAASTITVIGILMYQRSQKEAQSQSTLTDLKPRVKWDHNWDRRQPKLEEQQEVRLTGKEKDDGNEIEKKKPTVTRHIILIRHGQYYTDGATASDKRLTEIGKHQAILTAERLKSWALPYTAMISSSSIRAHETAEIIHKLLPDVPWTQTDILTEGFPVQWEPPFGGWKPENQYYTDGAKIEAAYRKYFHRAEPDREKDSYEILVCHANVIRYFVCRALQLPPEAWRRLVLVHGSITYIRIRPSGRVTLQSLGSDGHLPRHELTRKGRDGLAY